jgi:phage shock protein PspC (stress-responsive transcriptional regulator)
MILTIYLIGAALVVVVYGVIHGLSPFYNIEEYIPLIIVVTLFWPVVVPVFLLFILGKWIGKKLEQETTT